MTPIERIFEGQPLDESAWITVRDFCAWLHVERTWVVDLVEAGVLTSAEVGPGQVLTTLAAGHDWPSAAAAVRAAVQAAVARHGSRRSAGSGAAPTDPDAALHRIATQVLRTEVGPYAAGHGGGVELLAVHDGVVDVRMVGACHGCPAAGWTVQARLERHLRDEAPWTVGVRIVDRPAR